MSKRLAILTSGGDAPGMNAAVRAATLIALSQGYEVFGVQRGYRGLVEGDLTPLGPGDVASILREGGTMLGSARCLEFLERPARDRARAHLAERGIDQLLVIGGNGSLTGALAISDPEEAGGAVRVAGIPASIDNDIGLTGLAIGVDTAMNTIVEAMDKIADTATAHRRTFIVEVMGRDCGYLAMTAAIAGGADGVLFPEASRSEDEIVAAIVKTIRSVRAKPHKPRRVIVIKAEGVQIPVERLKERVDDELRSGARDPSDEVESRVTVLGHVVRGGRPSAFDRLLASRLANVAVRSLISGQTRKMAAWMPPADLPEECGERSEADPYCWVVDLTAALAETESLLSGASPLARWRAGVFEDIEDVLLL
jgi:6-phosphofructokinase 1